MWQYFWPHTVLAYPELKAEWVSTIGWVHPNYTFALGSFTLKV